MDINQVGKVQPGGRTSPSSTPVYIGTATIQMTFPNTAALTQQLPIGDQGSRSSECNNFQVSSSDYESHTKDQEVPALASCCVSWASDEEEEWGGVVLKNDASLLSN
ncbi:polyamine transporter [Aspergillus luchuensis]|uniref:Polyamine transporter n=1 Tax=Aspergillus kawachii TaxID=1069201 RepID=A0A146FU91_ASPKA|nr:polyamine transporter [Aspergillus luchuensis]